MTSIAVLNDQNRLVGVKKLPDDETPHRDDVVVPDDIDLPRNGTYKWVPDQGAFIPLGHGHGKPSRPPVPDAMALYHVIRATPDLPAECAEWARWYEENLLRAHEEQTLKGKNKRG